MNIQYMREYIVFCEYLNYSAAARELFISQPTLHQHIAALEEEVGMTLVDSSNAELSLTVSGDLLVDRAQDILNIYDRTLADIRKCNKTRINLYIQDHRQSIRIFEHFFKIAEAVQEKFPERIYQPKCIPITKKPPTEMLDKQAIDVCFYFSAQGSTKEIEELRNRGYDGFRLYTEPCFIYFHPDSELAHKESLGFGDLEGKTFIAKNNPSYASFRRAVQNTFDAYGVNLTYKLVPNEAALDLGLPYDDRYLIFDCKQHRDSAKLSFPYFTLVEREIEDVMLGLDVYIVFNPTKISYEVRDWLDVLRAFSP